MYETPLYIIFRNNDESFFVRISNTECCWFLPAFSINFYRLLLNFEHRYTVHFDAVLK